MTIAIISHPDCYQHNMGYGHPETPERLSAIQQALQTSSLQTRLKYYEAPLVEQKYLSQVHTQQYLEYLNASVPTSLEESYWLDGDTCLMKFTLPAALRAAGAATLAVDLVMQHETNATFCAVRPPGHHAKRARAMGFCYYNNVAIAAAYAIEQYNLQKVAIVDFDVHHGNGTEDIVTGNSKILLCSTFQHPFYPYEGAYTKAPNICNLPLPAGTNGQTYRAAVTKTLLPCLSEFQPQLIIFSAGFDGHSYDNMSMFNLLEADYAWITQQVKIIADQYAQSRIISCLEGGYNLEVLGKCVIAHLQSILSM
jgi:acetoin utilization deacetylase AcuC-like enzyme